MIASEKVHQAGVLAADREGDLNRDKTIAAETDLVQWVCPEMVHLAEVFRGKDSLADANRELTALLDSLAADFRRVEASQLVLYQVGDQRAVTTKADFVLAPRHALNSVAASFMIREVNVCFLVAMLPFLLCLAPAVAHDQSLSGMRIISRPENVLISVSTHLSQLSKAEHHAFNRSDSQDLDQALRKRVHLRVNGKDFVPGEAHLIADWANDQLIWQVFADKTASDFEVLSRLYPEARDSMMVVSFVREGVSCREEMLTREHPSLCRASAPGLGAWRYLKNGFGHIMSGPDHILFVFALLLLGGSIVLMLRIITAFTIAHSLTLALAATGTFVPPGRIIEPLIALSIVAVAIENLRLLSALVKERKSTNYLDRHVRDLRPMTAFVFGLIHGFGFAGALLEVGLPTEALWIALACFNLGVECGQAFLVVFITPLISLIRAKHPLFYIQLARSLSILVGLIGLGWFVARTVG
jgi:hypothetical protein